MWKAGIVLEWYPAASTNSVESPGMNGWMIAEPLRSEVFERCSSGDDTFA